MHVIEVTKQPGEPGGAGGARCTASSSRETEVRHAALPAAERSTTITLASGSRAAMEGATTIPSPPWRRPPGGKGLAARVPPRSAASMLELEPPVPPIRSDPKTV